MQKKIELKTEILRDKSIRVRLSLIRFDEENPSDELEHFHSITLHPGASLDNFRASNEAHLAMPFSQSSIPGAPWPAIPDSEWAEVEAIAALIHTPERIAKRAADDEQRKLKVSELINAAQAVRTK